MSQVKHRYQRYETFGMKLSVRNIRQAVVVRKCDHLGFCWWSCWTRKNRRWSGSLHRIEPLSELNLFLIESSWRSLCRNLLRESNSRNHTSGIMQQKSYCTGLQKTNNVKSAGNDTLSVITYDSKFSVINFYGQFRSANFPTNDQAARGDQKYPLTVKRFYQIRRFNLLRISC